MKKVKISPSFFLLAAAVWAVERELILPTLCAAAVHELGHVAALAAVGGKAEGLTLTALGAELRLRSGLSYARELPVALAGPACSLALALGAARLGAFLTAGLSLALGCFNLLPIRPLDGGRALGCVTGMLLSPVGAERVERTVAAAVLVGLGVLGAVCLRRGFGPGLLGMTLWLAWRTQGGEKTS